MSENMAEKTGLECALDLTSRAYEGIGFSIPSDWADELIRERGLVLSCGNGDMTGEAHAIFNYNDKTIRLKRDWMGHYEIFHGEWKPDPHWTGD